MTQAETVSFVWTEEDGPRLYLPKRARNHDRIVVKRAVGGWMFVYRSSNGRTLASSEVYTKRAWCVAMAERVGGGRVRVVVDDAAHGSR